MDHVTHRHMKKHSIYTPSWVTSSLLVELIGIHEHSTRYISSLLKFTNIASYTSIFFVYNLDLAKFLPKLKFTNTASCTSVSFVYNLDLDKFLPNIVTAESKGNRQQ